MRLEYHVGIKGHALAWLRSYLRSSVHVHNESSSHTKVNCGLPKLPLGSVIRKYGINFHSYADDT